MYYIVIRGNWRSEKNVTHFLEWFERFREEQRRWGVVSAKVFHAWFGGERQFMCLYGVESIDRWNAGQDTPSGFDAIMAIGEVVDVKSLKFEVVREIPVEF
jgi:hypothetical protein